jgi:fibronectin-binding autotransporter adhesin
MKKTFIAIVCTAWAFTALEADATTFLSDDFSHGSTLNQTPVAPTTTNTSYELVSSKTWSPTPAFTASDLKFGIAKTSSGSIEVQARFASLPVTLINPGDYIEITIVWTNTAGLFTNGGSFMGLGLYNSGGTPPLAGGLNGTATTSTTTNGGAQHWVGYVGQTVATGSSSRIMTRPDQSSTSTANNQDLVTSGSSSSSYVGAATVGTTVPSTLTLNLGGTYTMDLLIGLIDANTLGITNTLYDGVGTGGTMLTQFGGTAASPFLTAGFDSFAFGWRYNANTAATAIDVSSVQITGSATPVTGPPDITSEPVSASAPVGGACQFSVGASGYSMTYQWHRNGTNLVNGGNISGANSSMLVISPVSAADVSSSYYVTVSGAGGFSTNSTTASLSLRTANNLVWSGTGADWDVNTTADWLNGASASVFNYGDNVKFNDTGIANAAVNFAAPFLSAGSVTVSASSGNDYVFGGTGSFAGPGSLKYIGAGHLTINNANSYSGGTLISNANAYLVLNNYAGLGTGPVTLAQAGGQMEIVNSGSATAGIAGDIVIQDDFSISYDANSAFGAVFLGNLSGTAGKTLTINHNNNSPTTSRVRIFGTNTACAANILLNNPETTFASYQATGVQSYDGVISGSGSLMQKGTLTYLNGANTYSGGTIPATGAFGLGRDSAGSPVTSGPIGTGPLLLTVDSTSSTTGTGGILAAGGARTLGNDIQYPSGTNNLTLLIGGTNDLMLSGAYALNGQDGTTTFTNRFIQVTNTALTTISGVISDGGQGFGLTKTGNGILALSNTETYTGPTAVTNGTLRVNGTLGSGAVTVATNATLGGTGTINGPVTVVAGGILAPGNSIGTLNLNNSLTLGGNLLIEVNKAGSPTSDRINVSGTLSNTGTGTLTVTNLGSALAVNDSFQIFNKAVSNGGAISVTGGGSSVTWTNKLAIDGSIAVLAVVPTTPTNITTTVSGGTLTVSWPANYTGWTLQAQTNAPGAGISTNWSRITSSTSTNQMSFPIGLSNGSVFFRLVYP